MAKEAKLRVAVIFGGRSGEHEVSLMSARSVIDALDHEKYSIVEIGITHEGAWLAGEEVLKSFENGKTDHLVPVILSPDPTRRALYMVHTTGGAGERLEELPALDVVFPVLHGTFGEDGTLQGLLEMNGLPYVGSGVLGSSVGMDKGLFKDVMRANGIPILETLVLLRDELAAQPEMILDQAEELAPYPLFVKPANLGSSVGITKCQTRSDLYEGLLEAARFDRRILIERGIDGREIEVSVLGNGHPEASVPGEVIPSREFYSYEAKYIDDSSELLIPAPIPTEIQEEVRSLAVKAYQAIDCSGMARADFLLDKKDGRLYLNEVNTIPGFTRISMYPKLWNASGLPYPQLLDRLIALALERNKDRQRTEWRYQL